MRLLLMACICRANNDLPVYVGVHLSTRVATWPGVHSRYSLLLLVLCRTLDEIQQLTLNQIDLSSDILGQTKLTPWLYQTEQNRHSNIGCIHSS